MGLTQEDVLKKMSSIIDFSEISEFVDLPVRTYSSGMYLRLAFSIAIYAGSKIFIIDEVLSVGDEGFQKKSKEVMLKLIKGGIPPVFVSHSLPAVEEICNRVIWLDHGDVKVGGEPEAVIKRYRE